MSNVVLLGLDSLKKNQVAKLLGQEMNKIVLQCDELIEFENCMTVQQLVKKMGEEYYIKQCEKAFESFCEMENTLFVCPERFLIDKKIAREVLEQCDFLYLLNGKAAFAHKMHMYETFAWYECFSVASVPVKNKLPETLTQELLKKAEVSKAD